MIHVLVQYAYAYAEPFLLALCQIMPGSGSAPLGRTCPLSPVMIVIGLNRRSVMMNMSNIKSPRLNIPQGGGKLVPATVLPSLIKYSMLPPFTFSSYPWA